MKRIARFWRSSTTPAPAPESTVAAMDVDEEESVIDLTSDTEVCAEDAEGADAKSKVSGREIRPETEREG